MTDTKKTRNRRTLAERIAEAQARLAMLEAKKNGTFDASQDENYTTKRLRASIRARETAIKAAQVLLNGREATEKSPAQPTVEAKIANALARVQRLRDAQAAAVEQLAALPGDIDRLRDLLAKAEAGDESVEFPTSGLYVLPTEKSDVEIEATFERD